MFISIILCFFWLICAYIFALWIAAFWCCKVGAFYLYSSLTFVSFLLLELTIEMCESFDQRQEIAGKLKEGDMFSKTEYLGQLLRLNACKYIDSESFSVDLNASLELLVIRLIIFFHFFHGFSLYFFSNTFLYQGLLQIVGFECG